MNPKNPKKSMNSMNPKRYPRTVTLTVLVLVAILAWPVAPAKAEASGPWKKRRVSTDGTSEGKKNERFVTIDFNDVDIGVFIKFISELTGKNFVIDNRVKGKVTIISPAKISVDDAYRVFESVLEVNGFATVQAGRVTKIVPMPDARSKNIETRVESGAALRREDPEDRILTQLVPLKYADSATIKRLFTPLISKNSTILAYPDTNTLIVTDVQSNIKRLLKIIRAIDLPGVGQELSVIALEYANSEKLVKTLQSVFRPVKASPKGTTPSTVQFVSDERTNTIISMASENDTMRIKKLVEILDQEIPRGKGKIQVYYLENATAEDMAKVLQDLPQKNSTTKGKTTAPIVSESVRVTADKATNSLIIMADAEDYIVLEQVIRKLDIPRSMVYIEALFMEVNVEKSLNIGVEWSVLADTTLDGNAGASGGSFSADGGVSATELTNPTGMALGIIAGAIEMSIGGTTVTLPNVGAIATAFKQDEDVNLLSTPQILTTDNEEATIIVGRTIPFQTKTSTTSTGNETFNTFEYRDVGMTLKITPHISKDRLVRLKISQTLEALTGSPDDITTQPTTLKRSVDTTVIVKDRNTVVIGGLIDDTLTNKDTRVPCLGGMPLFGRLFRSEARSNQKTNLYIFITPHVIKSPVEAEEILNQKQDEMDVVREGQIKMYGADGSSDAAAREKGTQTLPGEN